MNDMNNSFQPDDSGDMLKNAAPQETEATKAARHAMAMDAVKKRRAHAFVWSSLALVVCVIVGIVCRETENALGAWIALGVMAFCLISCLIFDNNFVGEMIGNIFSWSFVTFPNIIFTFDLDGCLFLIGMKILFKLLGIAIGIACGALAIAVGLVVSVFVYPYAIVKHFRAPFDVG